jgi:hypothetical protein
MMSRRAQTLRPMFLAAIRQAETLPATEKADVYAGIALAARKIDPELAAQARDLAKALRDAEGLQRHFLNLLTAA